MRQCSYKMEARITMRKRRARVRAGIYSIVAGDTGGRASAREHGGTSGRADGRTGRVLSLTRFCTASVEVFMVGPTVIRMLQMSLVYL